MSIESQRNELLRVFADVEIIEVIEEAMSAKAPGRPRFSDMMARLEAGEADGLVAWAPDRLARNSIDGGRIVYQLDQGVLRDLKFATYTFENNPQGKFMLAIMFGQSKYYSDALSENVKRGNRTKIEHGWRPNVAPIGYLNERATKTIVPDPVHFPLIRRMFELILAGTHSPRQVALVARDEWGFRTPIRRKIGGVPLAMSSVYKILSNPFYAGLILWGGQLYPGKHNPVVSIEEFNRVRALLSRPSQPRPKHHSFAFTGLMRCGTCGLGVTAEHKRNRYGSRYIYYHCTNKRLGSRCPEPVIEVRALERQIVAFLRSIAIPASIENIVLSTLDAERLSISEVEIARRRSLERTAVAVEDQLRELTGLRVRSLISDEEFQERRRELQEERLGLMSSLAEPDETDLIEPARLAVSFSIRAAEWFERGDDATKRLILEIAGSNPCLIDGKLSVQAAKPFVALAELATSPSLLAAVEDVRTFLPKENRLPAKLQLQLRRFAETFAALECQIIVVNLRKLTTLVEREEDLKEAA